MQASIALWLQSSLDVLEDNILSDTCITCRIGWPDCIARTCDPAISPEVNTIKKGGICKVVKKCNRAEHARSQHQSAFRLVLDSSSVLPYTGAEYDMKAFKYTWRKRNEYDILSRVL